MSKNFNHEDFSHWIFDLDNTLYPEDENIFPKENIISIPTEILLKQKLFHLHSDLSLQ